MFSIYKKEWIDGKEDLLEVDVFDTWEEAQEELDYLLVNKEKGQFFYIERN